ncbi:MAG TPA: ParB N-terminal domain-containing protein [Candidatus Sulfotelmatobacter sp.]|jgi:hypothetical protein|nr:ParB N-terminal domain-containing protein [Candidatus Sulfotelmatobacter sp.]
MEIKLVEINTLKEFDKNPRNITEEGMTRLKKQIQKLGQYKPLVITADGIVLGGNMRFRALKEMGIEKVWVSVVKPKDNNEMLEYTFSDNDRAGFYDEDLLEKLLPEFSLDWSEYAVDTLEPILINDLFSKTQENFDGKNKEVDSNNLDSDLNAQCPRCGFQFKHESA